MHAYSPAETCPFSVVCNPLVGGLMDLEQVESTVVKSQLCKKKKKTKAPLIYWITEFTSGRGS